MHVLSGEFCARLDEAGVDVVNLHPALPGAYSGAGAIERAWGDFQRREEGEGASGGNGKKKMVTGVMVHYVVAEVDMGEPIVVQEVEMRVGETRAELEARIHEVEHVLIVEGTRVALENRVSGRRGKGRGTGVINGDGTG